VATDAAQRLTRERRALHLHGIYAILNESPRVLELAHAVLGAGIGVVQYRAKSGIDDEHLRALRGLTRERGALLVLNDDWRAAREFDCDGVHLGPGDDGFDAVAPIREALSDRLVGLSCATLEEVRGANAAGADYLGVGSVFATKSKSDAGAPIGPQRLRELVAASAVPVAAIGGITAPLIAGVRRCGAAMAAVISAIDGAPDPQRAARELVDAWDR